MNRFATQTVVLAAIMLAWASAATAADSSSGGNGQGGAQALRDHLERNYPDFQVDGINETPLPGIYEVVSGTDVMYVSGDGRYLLRGSLVDLDNGRNLTQQRRGDLVRKQIERVSADSMLIYPPANGGEARYRITVFTDPTCPYCQRLHEDLMALRQAYPLQVRYLMFPRAGLNGKGARQLRQVWCSADPQAAMTRAKKGETLDVDVNDCQTPIEQQFQLAQQLGASGTPFLIIGEDGPVRSGYLPKKQLVSALGMGKSARAAQAK